MKDISFIKDHNITLITPLNKGWSKDKKYILEDNNGIKYLLRLSQKELFEAKQRQYEYLKKVESSHVNCPKPIDFGVLENGDVYMILTYLEGMDSKEIISKLSNTEAYHLGISAGEILRKLHHIEIPKQDITWWDKYQNKMYRKIDALRKCQYQIPMQEDIIKYYEEYSYLMHNRPQTFTHGDFHLGNMIVSNGEIGIIDFDKNGISDPYDDLKPFCWTVMESEYFETGLINGYFENQIPENFFKILKFYTAESLISHLPWATTFGEEEVQTAIFVANKQMEWYDNFKLEIPSWYKGLIE